VQLTPKWDKDTQRVFFKKSELDDYDVLLNSYAVRQRKAVVVIFIAFLIIIAILTIVYQLVRQRPSFYSGFGIQLPPHFSIIGIDVSRYQGAIFWKEVARMSDQNRRLYFAFMKATDGTNYVDPRFHCNWKEAGENGVARDAYHYFHPAQSAQLQAGNFLENTAFIAGDLRPVLDVEVSKSASANSLRDSICSWLNIVGSKYHTTPIIYTNASFYNQFLKGYFDDYPLWIAHYKTEKPAIKIDFQFWQFSDAGQANGISTKVDFNVFNGDSLGFEKMKL